MGAAEEHLLIYINSCFTIEHSDTEEDAAGLQDVDSLTRSHRRMDASRMTRQDLEAMKWGLLPSALA